MTGKIFQFVQNQHMKHAYGILNMFKNSASGKSKAIKKEIKKLSGSPLATVSSTSLEDLEAFSWNKGGFKEVEGKRV